MRSHLHFTRRPDVAFTLLELMIAMVVIGIVVVVLLPGLAPAHRHNHDPIIRCVNNLKQVGLSFRLWAGDNDEKYPMRVPVAKGGTLELVDGGMVAPHFGVMSNELGTPKILVCYVDSSREMATNFATLQDSNVSYFVNVSAAKDKPDMWLAGDRNLTIGKSPARGMIDFNSNTQVDWSEAMHNRKGAVAFADGSVQQLSSRKLLESLRAQTNITSRLAFPQ